MAQQHGNVEWFGQQVGTDPVLSTVIGGALLTLEKTMKLIVEMKDQAAFDGMLACIENVLGQGKYCIDHGQAYKTINDGDLEE